MTGYALVFPGQGSQKVGMGADFADGSPAARELFQPASVVLGSDIADLCLNGRVETLSRTEYTQPALYVTSCAAFEAARETGALTAPMGVAGHSVGEYAALYVAGAFSFDEGLRLVAVRAGLMGEAAASCPGAMAAVLGLDLGRVEWCCCEAASVGVVTVANDNCPGQVVISGEVGAVEAASAIARDNGARRVVRLPVSGGFHSPLMAGVAEELGRALQSADIRDVEVPVVANFTAESVVRASEVRGNLVAQVAGRVRWQESMRRLIRNGMSLCIELGSGDVLTGLMRRIDSGVAALAAHDMTSLRRAMDAASAGG